MAFISSKEVGRARVEQILAEMQDRAIGNYDQDAEMHRVYGEYHGLSLSDAQEIVDTIQAAGWFVYARYRIYDPCLDVEVRRVRDDEPLFREGLTVFQTLEEEQEDARRYSDLPSTTSTRPRAATARRSGRGTSQRRT